MTNPGLNSVYSTREAGAVSNAFPLWTKLPLLSSPLAKRGQYTAAQIAGLRYERKAQNHLLEHVPHFVPHLPFSFFANDNFKRQLAIPDGIAFNNAGTLITIVEIKNRHTGDGWFQLFKLYFPIVSKAFPGRQVKLLEVCKTYEPSVRLNLPFDLVQDVATWVETKEGPLFGIYNWTSKT